MTYDEAIQFLYGLRMFGAKLGLENTARLAALAGNPQQHLRFIHVAGTNGKGSTCAMLEGIYRAAGWRVGLFTSPHLISFTERIQINRVPIPRARVAQLVGELEELLRGCPAEQHPTFFEVVTVLALRYFAEERSELVVWETGLGGRLDATNIVTPLACVITGIDLDHQLWLGDRLERIAAEKAGIIKRGVPVLTGASAGRGLEVIEAVAGEQGAPLTVVGDPGPALATLAPVKLSLPGDHQKRNAALALSTVEVLAGVLPVNREARREGLSRVKWPGRFQVTAQPGGRTVVLDGAHNVAGTTALRTTWEAEFPGIQPALIMGFLADKDWTAMAQALVPLARRVLLVPVDSARGLAPSTLAPVCRQAHPAATVEVCGALKEALAATAHEPWVLIAGSLYLIGEAMEQLGLEAGTAAAGPAEPGASSQAGAATGAAGASGTGTSERALNEWGANLAPNA